MNFTLVPKSGLSKELMAAQEEILRQVKVNDRLRTENEKLRAIIYHPAWDKLTHICQRVNARDIDPWEFLSLFADEFQHIEQARYEAVYPQTEDKS